VSDKFRATYYAADGYVCRDRPKTFTIVADDIEDEMTDDEILDFYQCACEDHFTQNVSCDYAKEAEFLTWAKAQIAARK